MSVFLDIQNALDARLYAMPSVPQIAWPNTNYKPMNTTSYLRPTLLPAESEIFTLNEYNRHSGIYQIDIFTQLNRGVSPLLTIADNIRNHFKADLILTKNDTTVHIQEISLSTPQREESWYSCYVAVNYVCFK